MRVALLPLGDVPPDMLERLAAKLGGSGFACVVRDASAPPPEGFVPGRGQWDAAQILEDLAAPPGETLLAVTDGDLFVEGLRFVFGLANAERRVGLVSVAHLRSRTARVTDARLLKEATHEIGHVLGLAHCPRATCVMHFSNSLADTDAKGVAPCGSCEARLPAEASQAFARLRTA